MALHLGRQAQRGNAGYVPRAHHLCNSVTRCLPCPNVKREQLRSSVVLASHNDLEEARSPLEAPQEFEAPSPSRRPDIFPEFEKLDRTILPKPLPGDPELPDEEEEEAAKRTQPGDPDPEGQPWEPDIPVEEPAEPGQSPPDKEPNIPTIPA